MCHKCNEQNYHAPCGCSETPCVEQTPCDCAVSNLNTKCLVYSGETLACTGIEQGVNFDEFLLALDAYICTAISQLQASINLTNIGTGSKVYKGLDNLGRRELRTIAKIGNLITVTENSDNIAISIDETALNAFIEANQKTYTALNVGTGATLLKNITTVGDITTFNFKSIIIDEQGGMGESFLRDVQQNTNDVTFRIKKLKSNTLTISSTDTEVSIEQPSTSTIPALYVNDLYIPSEEEFLAGNTKGFGTLSRPITNTITAYVAGVPTITPNTAIQNAKDKYIGSGTALAPELEGQKIIIQDNNGTYTFAGNFNAQNIDIEIQGDVLSTTTGFLVDMDDNTKFNASTARATITRNQGATLEIQGNGFNNSGNAVGTTTYATGRILNLLGEGRIYTSTNNITKYVINSDTSNSGNNNDGNNTFILEGVIEATLQGIYLVGGVSRVNCYGELTSGTLTNQVNVGLKAFHQTGGTVKLYAGASKRILGAISNPRTSAITFNTISPYTANYVSQNATYIGEAITLFDKQSTEPTTLSVTSSDSGYDITLTNIFTSVDLWEVRFTNNIFGTGVLDVTQVDLTQGNNTSSINTIGNNLVETLVKYVSRTSAEASLPIGSKFINTNSNNVNLNTWFIDITMQ